MKIKLDDSVSPEIKDFLLSQEGITNVDINYDDYFISLDIKFNQTTTPLIVMKYIDLFQKNKHSKLVEFDKEYIGKIKILKYMIDDICCENCYMELVMDLFENNKIKSVKSNFDFKNTFNIEFLIEYDESYNEKELIEYIKEKYDKYR